MLTILKEFMKVNMVLGAVVLIIGRFVDMLSQRHLLLE